MQCATDPKLTDIDEEQVKNMANKYALQWGINPSARSFQFLFRHGIDWALQQLPQRLFFFSLLIPFLQRSSADDLKYATYRFRDLGTRALKEQAPPAAERSEEDDWHYLKDFCDAINKKFARPILVVADDEIRGYQQGDTPAITGAGAGAVAATPAKKSAKKSDKITGKKDE